MSSSSSITDAKQSITDVQTNIRLIILTVSNLYFGKLTFGVHYF